MGPILCPCNAFGWLMGVISIYRSGTRAMNPHNLQTFLQAKTLFYWTGFVKTQVSKKSKTNVGVIVGCLEHRYLVIVEVCIAASHPWVRVVV